MLNGSRHQTVDSDEVAFLMVNNNSTTVEKALDGIRERRQKFVCLNDNLNHSDPSARDVSKNLRTFSDAKGRESHESILRVIVRTTVQF